MPDGERPVLVQPSEPEMQAVLDVKAGLPTKRPT
jgi:hypothetical protein